MSKVLKLSGEQLSKKLAESIDDVSPTSKELIIGLVGYAGAGCSLVAEKIGEFLYSMGNYKPVPIKLSSIIEKWSDPDELKAISIGPEKGKEKLSRAMTLQNIGDRLRQRFQPHPVAALAVKKIIELRGKTAPGEEKIVFILDSIKHEDEVHLLRRVYDKSFRLVAVHCEREIREERLIGEIGTQAKYKGAAAQDVRSYMDRDERDEKNKKGQHVRDAFYLADFFIDNNVKTVDGVRLNDGIKRFVSLMLGRDLVRPTMHETGMFHAHAAALQSGCLSRQVGAALLASDGRVISTGTNDVPRFGGGVYSEGSRPDERCFRYKWQKFTGKKGKDGRPDFEVWSGCHNDRKKTNLRKDIANWIAEEFSGKFAELAHPKPQDGGDIAARARSEAEGRIRKYIVESRDDFVEMPGVKDIIEYSRAIHAEMTTVLNTARHGLSTMGTFMYCTTFPCHNCARHLVASGVCAVYYIEPYVKSLAVELHGDAISTVLPPNNPDTGKPETPDKMLILPFTGVGPRMYEDFFQKKCDLKIKGSGEYDPPVGGSPALAVRLSELVSVEELAASLVPDEVK